jgi:hypothetical protein
VAVRVLIDLVAMSRVAIAPAPNRAPPHLTDQAATGAGSWSPRGAATEARPPVNQLAMPTVGRLARGGQIELCSYAEICGTPAVSMPSGTLLDLLGAVTIVTVEPAIDRTAIDRDVFRDDAQPGALLRFCTRLKAGHRVLEQLSADLLAQLPATSRRGVASLQRFCELAARTQGEHLVDLFHLWTGELAGCRYFLTLDDRLGEFLDHRVRPGLGTPLTCDPVEPEQLLHRLGLADRDPPPALPGTVVDLRRARSRRARGCAL